MPKISLTTFVDFTTSAGSTRLTKVKRAKAEYGQDYSPQKDFYKALREAIEESFEEGWTASELKKRLAKVPDPKKRQNYESCRKGLTKWAGNKSFVVHPKQRASWKSGELTVKVNPELDLTINGTRHRIKLYFKGEAISKSRIDVILHLLGSANSKATPGVLDVRRSKLYVPTVERPGLGALLKAEAAAFSSLWQSI
jgi:hypothetical protein